MSLNADRKRQAFTLVELLVVIGIVALLASIIYPVFAQSRARARQTVCLSNLRQLGTAIALYAGDYNEMFPYGGDPGDTQTDGWQFADGGQFWPEAHNLTPLPVVLQPYIDSADIWHCPADTGYDEEDSGGGNNILSAHPSSFAAFGTSYSYHTELTLRRKTLANCGGYDPFPPYAQHSPAETFLMSDFVGNWHGEASGPNRRYNTLLADGHVKSLNRPALENALLLLVNPPAP